VRARIVRCQFPFNDGQEFADFRPFRLPSEMDGDAILFVSGTEPEIVGFDGADLGDHQVRADFFVQSLDGENGVEGAFVRNEIFRL